MKVTVCRTINLNACLFAENILKNNSPEFYAGREFSILSEQLGSVKHRISFQNFIIKISQNKSLILLKTVINIPYIFFRFENERFILFIANQKKKIYI